MKDCMTNTTSLKAMHCRVCQLKQFQGRFIDPPPLQAQAL